MVFSVSGSFDSAICFRWIILIAHNIEHVINVADRVVILRNGERVASLDFEDYTNKTDTLHHDIVKGITGIL